MKGPKYEVQCGRAGRPDALRACPEHEDDLRRVWGLHARYDLESVTKDARLGECAWCAAEQDGTEPPGRSRGRPAIDPDGSEPERVRLAQRHREELDRIVEDGAAKGRAEAIRYLIDESAARRK